MSELRSGSFCRARFTNTDQLGTEAIVITVTGAASGEGSGPFDDVHNDKPFPKAVLKRGRELADLAETRLLILDLTNHQPDALIRHKWREAVAECHGMGYQVVSFANEPEKADRSSTAAAAPKGSAWTKIPVISKLDFALVKMTFLISTLLSGAGFIWHKYTSTFPLPESAPVHAPDNRVVTAGARDRVIEEIRKLAEKAGVQVDVKPATPEPCAVPAE